MLRPYQQNAIDQLYGWFEFNSGNPCLVLPTGSGKSHIIAALCKDALQQWPETRILMLTHVKELIEQNAEKMRQHWPNAPLGIYSAGIGRRELGESITFAGIQSVRNKPEQIGHVDIILIDECHLVSHKDEGGYRTLITELNIINPNLRVIGLTGSPYRLGHGLITEKPAIFDALIEPVSIEQLIFQGYLAPLRSKHTKAILDVTGVHKKGGEYIESELQAAVNTDANNTAAVSEIMSLSEGRKAWLIFCAGVKHAENIAAILQAEGVTAACVTGDTPKAERNRILTEFKAGKIRALTNANVLTTGFDYPDIDLIGMLRPTMSASLYVQMAGRGMRPKSAAKDCLVLDFAGNVSRHGAITNVKPPSKKGEKEGEAPIKLCPECAEIVHMSVRECPGCGFAFPPPAPPKLKLYDDDIMGKDGTEMRVRSWTWRRHISRASGNEMLSVTYYGALSDPPITEYLAVLNQGYAGQKANNLLMLLARLSGAMQIVDSDANWLDSVSRAMNQARPPEIIEYKKDGKFFTLMKRKYDHATQEADFADSVRGQDAGAPSTSLSQLRLLPQ
jgi:DNA repair protein RadD